MSRFEVGDKAVVTTKIRRVDGKSTVYPGDVVTITAVYNATSGNQIVDIEPGGNQAKMVDIVIIEGSDVPLRRVMLLDAGGGTDKGAGGKKTMLDFQNIVDETPQLKRGCVWCRKCGASKSVNAAECLQSGWPKCCGFTMTIDSPEEQRAFALGRSAREGEDDLLV